ncbi:MAG: serine protease [Candidatus Falkowbacteria bacterium]
MTKKKIVFAAIVLFFCSLSAHAQSTGQGGSLNINDLPDPKLNRAVVKVKVYAITASNALENLGYGSGVIIDDKGTILTNYHVAVSERDYDNKPRVMGYEICLNEEVSQEPDCSYGASYIAGDKELDLALLKIVPLPGGKAVPALKVMPIAEGDGVQANDEVVALGYPAIGGDNMTVTRGIISGKQDKYGKKWIKSDAMMSFGNSGGAAVNRKGELVGVTSAGHSDMLGSLGYIINAASITPWIKANGGKTPVPSALADRVAKFAAQEKLLETSNVFTSEKNSFRITKPADWQFDYTYENGLDILKKEDREAGRISISVMTFAFPITSANFNKMVDTSMAVDDPFYQVQSNDPVVVKSGEARRIATSGTSGDTNTYIFSHANNYLLQISYDYGSNDRDEKIVEQIISSLEIINPAKPFAPVTTFKSDNGVYNYVVKPVSGWGLRTYAGDEPAGFAMNSTGGNFLITAEFSKEDSKAAKLTNDQKLKNQRKQLDAAKGQMKDMGVTVSYKDSATCAITDKHKGTYAEILMKKDGKTYLVMEYSIRTQGKVLSLSSLALNSRGTNITKTRAELDKALSGLTIEGSKFKGGCSAK